MSEMWLSATRRLWLGIVVRTVCGALVLSPAVAAVSLLVARFVLGTPEAFGYILLPLSLVTHLLVWLWATRNALRQSNPEGAFRLVARETEA